MESKDLKTISEKKYINKVTLGDCVKFLERLPSECVDICFADPPFNLKKSYGFYDDNLDEEEYLNWCEKWLIQLIRVTKLSGSIFIHNIPSWLIRFSERLSSKTGIHFQKWIVWDAMSGANGSNLYPAHYGILYFVRDFEKNKFYKIRYPHKRERTTNRLSKDWGGKKELMHPFGSLVTDVWADIYRVKHERFKDKHPCQLPIHLLQRIILMSTDENDIVLDPFIGTGTAAIAAKSLGRNFIGFEIDKDYAKIARTKIKETIPNSKIGSSWVSYFNGEIVTIRDTDWTKLKSYFQIPKDKKQLEYQKIELKDESLTDGLIFKFYKS